MIADRWLAVVNVGGVAIPQYALCELRPGPVSQPEIPGVRLAAAGATGALGVAPVACAPGGRGAVVLYGDTPLLTVGTVAATDTLQPSATPGYAEVGTTDPYATAIAVAATGLVTAVLPGPGSVVTVLPTAAGAWQDWTPTVTQQGALTLSQVLYARYRVANGLVTIEGAVVIGSAGTAGWPILIAGLPSSLVALSEVLKVVGVGQYQNPSVNWLGGLAWEPPSPGTLAIRRDGSPTGTGFTGRAYVGKDPSPGFAVSAGDALYWSGQWAVQ